jgi:phosphopantothenate---cysteine ligase (CTP)
MNGSKRFLVTAGNTREMIDRVRDWGNIFTGNTGFSIATALARIGGVDLVTSNSQHLGAAKDNASMQGFGYRSHQDLILTLEDRMRSTQYDAVFMTAAVADYKPAGTFAVMSRDPTGNAGEERWIVRNVQAAKVKSSHKAIAFYGEPTEKIIDLFRSRWNYRGMLVKFKLEVDVDPQRLQEVGQKSRKTSGADYLVANSLDMVSGEKAGAFVLSDQGSEWVPRDQLASRMVSLVEERMRNANRHE